MWPNANYVHTYIIVLVPIPAELDVLPMFGCPFLQSLGLESGLTVLAGHIGAQLSQLCLMKAGIAALKYCQNQLIGSKPKHMWLTSVL